MTNYGLAVTVTASGPVAFGTPIKDGSVITLHYDLDASFNGTGICADDCTIGFFLANITENGDYTYNGIVGQYGLIRATDSAGILQLWEGALGLRKSNTADVGIPYSYVGGKLAYGFFYMVGKKELNWGEKIKPVPGVNPVTIDTSRKKDCQIVPQEQNIEIKMNTNETTNTKKTIATRTIYCEKIGVTLKQDVPNTANENGPLVSLYLGTKNMEAGKTYTLTPGVTIDVFVEITTTTATVGGEYNYTKIIILEPL